MSTNVTSDMWEGHFNSDPTNFEEPPYHFFVTDHPYMATLGLSQFTTGTLYRWWNQRNDKGEYFNRKYFDGSNGDSPSTILLNGINYNDKTGEGENELSFKAWRKDLSNPNAGKYVIKYIDGDWNFQDSGKNEAGDLKDYTYQDLKIDEYDDCFLSIDENLDLEKLNVFTIPNGKGATKDIIFKGIKPITNVICMNDYVNHLEYDNPDRATWQTKDFARSEFILDIQTSKAPGGGLGYVEWSAMVPFNISITDPTDGKVFICQKTEKVNYKLFLYPHNMPRSSRRNLTIAKPIFAAPPKDALGRTYEYREDGRFSAFPEGSQASEIAGELDMTYNDSTGKWEAGSKGLVAVISKNVTAANIPDLTKLTSTDPKYMLEHPEDLTSHIIFGTGAAIPIVMQNANPQQHTPTYVEQYDVKNGKFISCPEKSSRVYEVKVFNHTQNEIPSGTSVTLTQIQGLWFVQDTQKAPVIPVPPTGLFDGKWEFTYCATNFVHYFRDKNFNLINYKHIENGFHKKYYTDLNNSLNKDTFDSDLAGWSLNELQAGYYQFTSFDFMDNQIMGTRNVGPTSNALGVTNPLVGPNGETVDSTANGESTGAFFGCIFPDGYNSDQIAIYKNLRKFKSVPRIASSGDAAFSSHQQFNNISNYEYFSELNNDILPFNNGQNRHDIIDGFSVDGQLIPMFKDNDIRLTNLPADIATNASPFGDNGQPIRNIHYFNYLYLSPIFNIENYNLGIKESLNFLKKEYDSTEPNYELKNELFLEHSALDFKPVRPNHIMFRPLKAELYAHLIKDIDPTVSFPISINTFKTRRAFSSMLAAYTNSKKRLISQTAVDRELNADILWGNVGTYDGLFGNVYNLHNDIWGLQFNIDLPADLNYAGRKYHVSPNAAFNPGNNTERFHVNAWGLWQNLWCHGGNDITASIGLKPAWRSFTQEPAGAVGIIGAVASCTANNSIIFDTVNRLGCWSWSLITPLFNRQHATWGKNNFIHSLNTTNLFVKIYHAWPREQTVYDPRYFAVHHFNPGIYDVYNNNNSEIKHEIQKLDQLDSNNNLIQVQYEIDIESHDVDIRVPSAKQLPGAINTSNIFRPIELPTGTKIYGNISFDGTEIHDSLLKNQWNIDDQRRSKLLPYKYMFLTIGISNLEVELPTYDSDIYNNGGYAIKADGTPIEFFNFLTPNNPSKTFDPLTNPDDDIVFIVKNPGTGYEVGETFSCSTTFGKEFLLTITEIELEEKRIKKFQITKPGYDFSYQGFTSISKPLPPSPGKLITKNTTGIPIITGGENPTKSGQGFVLHLIRGEVILKQLKDEKPNIATEEEINMISITALASSDTETQGSANPPFGLLSDQRKVDISITNPSVNRKYDLFFHFHNDISHTFKYPWKNSTDVPNNDEQYIELTITTN